MDDMKIPKGTILLVTEKSTPEPYDGVDIKVPHIQFDAEAIYVPAKKGSSE
jgi:hypothetical protein